MLPAPKRGEIVRQMGEVLRDHKDDLGALVSMEVGKVLSEGWVKCKRASIWLTFALVCLTVVWACMHSERPLHRMYEQWQPLCPIGVITAFDSQMRFGLGMRWSHLSVVTQ